MKKRVATALVSASAAGVGMMWASSPAAANVTGFGTFAAPNVTSSDTGAPYAGATIGYSNGNGTFTLTDGQNTEASSGFSTAAQNIAGSWTASFNYNVVPQLVVGTNGYLAADGFSFIVQNDTRGTKALGYDGGNLGWGGGTSNDGTFTAPAINPAVAVSVELFNGYYYTGAFAPGSMGTNISSSPTSTPSTPNGLGNANVGSSAPNSPVIAVTYTYNAGTQVLKETYVNQSTGGSFVHVDSGLNIPAAVGGSTALVGFTGGTGGYNCTQTVSNFTFTTGSATGVVAPPAPATAVYTPLAITSGFNNATVVPAIATGETNANINGYLTATVDNGQNETFLEGTGSTWYEQGFNGSSKSGAPSIAGSGLPKGGSTFTSQADTRHQFTMPVFSDGTQDDSPVNNTVVLDSAGITNSNGTTDSSQKLTFGAASQKAYASLSFLAACGNGPAPMDVVVNYVNGTSVDLGDINIGDWFSGPGTVAYATSGRYYDDADVINDNTSGQPDLFQYDLGLTDTTDPVAGVTLTYDGGTGSEITLFAVSGGTVPVAVPEPASLGLLVVAGVSLVARRRSRN